MAVRPPITVLGACAGAAGLELAVRLAYPRARTVCLIEREAFAAATLVARMEDKALDPAPVWDDVTTFDGRPWRGRVDLVAAGFPCQPWSQAGNGLGVADPRWLWPALADIIADVAPPRRVPRERHPTRPRRRTRPRPPFAWRPRVRCGMGDGRRGRPWRPPSPPPPIRPGLPR